MNTSRDHIQSLMDRGTIRKEHILAMLDEIDRLRAEVAVLKAERDEALLRWQRLYGEIDCRVEHGADSNGHLEAIRKMMQKEAKP